MFLLKFCFAKLLSYSAFGGIADIEWAFLHPIRNGLLPDYENKYLLVGFDTNGNPVEIMYNRIDGERINVFHAMKCRKAFLPRDTHNQE